MGTDPSFDWQEIVRTFLSFFVPLVGWFGGKYLFNRYEKRQKEIENEKSEQEVAVEAGEAVATFAKVAKDTGDFNVDLRKEIREMRERMFALEDRVMILEREKALLAERNHKLEGRVKDLENILRDHNWPIPENGV